MNPFTSSRRSLPPRPRPIYVIQRHRRLSQPDLAIEVDISRPQVDRAGIYAALRVAEVWRFDGEQVVIERLTAEGKLRGRRRQRLPAGPGRGSPAPGLGRGGYSLDDSAWARRLRAEIRSRTPTLNTKQRMRWFIIKNTGPLDQVHQHNQTSVARGSFDHVGFKNHRESSAGGSSWSWSWPCSACWP